MTALSEIAWPAGVVFDMDGLLLDSERLARDCFVAACADLQFEPDLVVYERCVGRTYDETREILRVGFGPAFPLDLVGQRWGERYDAHVRVHPVDLKAGVAELLRALSVAAIPLAVATSSRREDAELKLAMAGVEGYFAALVCAGEVARGKPHPDPYLRAAALLEQDPARCWACEDSDNGTRAAIAAGLTVFQIPDLIPPAAPARHHRILPSLFDVVEVLSRIAKPGTF